MIAAVPQIENLTVQDFLDHAKTKPGLLTYLPDEADWLHVDKKWLVDIIFTLDKESVQ